jgi:CheY-specific phosphatase CheX
MDDEDTWISALVQVTGEWNGAIRLDCTNSLARKATARMHGIESSQVSTESACDAIAELANMIAGLMKTLLSGSGHNSLPTVAYGMRYEFAVPNSIPIARFGFECHSNYLSVTIYKRQKVQRCVTAARAAPPRVVKK